MGREGPGWVYRRKEVIGMIITDENYVVDPVVMATDSYRIANGHRLFIDSRPISYRYLEGTFEYL